MSPGRDSNDYRCERAASEHADGLLALFESAGSGCFCQYWYFEGDKNAWLERCYIRPEENRAALVARLARPELCGVVARSARGEVCGWMNVSRAGSVPRLYDQRVYRSLPCFQSGAGEGELSDRENVFAVACCYVAEAERGRGVGRALLATAIAEVRNAGGSALEAFPRATPEGERLRADEVWQGPIGLFTSMGFTAVSDFGPTRCCAYSFADARVFPEASAKPAAHVDKAASNGVCLRGCLYCAPRSLHEFLVLQAVRLIRLEVFHDLAQRLAGESVGGYLGDCLDALLTGTAAKSAIAFTVDDRLELVADRGLDASRRPLAALLRGASALAERALATRKPAKCVDLRVDRDGVDDAGEFVVLGTPSVLALPILDLRTPIGAFVLLFANPSELDLETVTFASSIASLAALRTQRDRHRGEKLSTEQQEETAHMVSLGLLTATVAHELRGPAGALLLQQEELKRLVEQLDVLDGGADTAIGEAVAELSELSTDIGTAVARVRDTVEQLSTVSRRELSPEHVQLSEVVEESLTVVKPHLERRGIHLVTSFDPGCYTIARRDNLAQVVLNLTLNAMDACQGSTQPEVTVRVLEAGEHVALVVEDNGPGVPDSAIPHIFKPFYTTKERGAGTGLGLKICSDVVTAHGGHIEVHQRTGGGASFRVLLPRAREDSGVLALPVAAPPRAVIVPVRRKHVLVVDDDPVFSRTIRRSLKPHDVRTCAAASEAQAMLLDPAYAPDLVLCDVFLPGANGNLLHSRIARHRPEIARRFVFVTGGALGKDEASYLRASGCTTLFKPVELRSLLELLEDPNPASSPPNTVKTLLQEPPSSSNRSPSVR